MTCIVGLVEGNSIVMGGDSAGVSGWDLTVRKDPKVFINGPCVMGFTSSFRMGQLLQYKLKVPAQRGGQDAHEFMATDFVDAVRSCLKEGGYAKKDHEEESAGVFLVGYAGRLFRVDSDYQVGESEDSIMACGCGRDIALGALHALRNHKDKYTGHGRVMAALEAAERFCAGVRGPFVILQN
jgi:ATP-dependent protease HslVU (ClpYQ) peptidase subunit